MRSKSFLLLPAVALALTCATVFPSASRAQAKREVATELYKPGYLFLRNEEYNLNVDVPEKQAATDVPAQVVSFKVECKFTQKGPAEIRDLKLECQGVTYAVPPHKLVVLDEQPKTPGLSIQTEPDPNGSGNVELVVCWSGDKRPEPDFIDVCDPAARPKGIDLIRSNGASGGSDGAKHWELLMEMLIRNKTDAPFTIKPEFFKNVPPVKAWPEIVIPPAKSK